MIKLEAFSKIEKNLGGKKITNKFSKKISNLSTNNINFVFKWKPSDKMDEFYDDIIYVNNINVKKSTNVL